MALEVIYAFLVHPGKGQQTIQKVTGKKIPNSGELYNMLNGIFKADPEHRDFEILFNPCADGTQQNDCRDLLVAFQAQPTGKTGRAIARRLQAATDNRSGIGLMFLIVGYVGLNRRLVISRFPTDKAILANVGSSGLDVQFLKQVFIKRLSSYKALMLEHVDPNSQYWNGRATDRQAGGIAENISDYWITDFLNADFAETPAAGTRRLAEALKSAIKSNPNPIVKNEIASAATLAGGAFKGKAISIEDFCDHFGFSKATKETIRNSLTKPSLYTKMFKFSNKDFKEVAPFRTVEIDNGAILTAPSGEFDKVFEVSTSDGGKVQYRTSGRIKDQRLSKR